MFSNSGGEHHFLDVRRFLKSHSHAHADGVDNLITQSTPTFANAVAPVSTSAPAEPLAVSQKTISGSQESDRALPVASREKKEIDGDGEVERKAGPVEKKVSSYEEGEEGPKKIEEVTPSVALAKKTALTTTADDVDSVGEEDLTSGAKDALANAGKDIAGEETGAGAKVASSKTARFPPMEDEKSTRRCYFSGVTDDTLCVHTPLCVRHTGIVYIAENLKCAPYSNVHGILGTLSTRRCVEIETENEQRADIADPEHKGNDWLETLQRDDKIQWYEGETVFLSLSEKSRSVAHYSQRIFFLHHVLLHPQRYGMGRISNVVIVAHDEVARKIKFRKSWHFGLLAAIVHPNKPNFKYQDMKSLISEGVAAPGVLRVFVPSGFENLAKGRQVPCFRRASVTSALHSQYLLTQDKYPGVAPHGIESTKGDDAVRAAAHKRGKYFDGAMFRKQVFASLDLDDPPPRKHLVYLHRAKGRVLSTAGQMRLEASLKEVASELGYKYEYIDLAGMSFSEQVDATSKASIAVGVHGMQLMASLFMPADGALVEIFPYKFWHDLYTNGCGSGLSYQSMSLSEGTDFLELPKFKDGLESCVKESKDCRMWYRSDDRELELNDGDASEIQGMVRQAAANVASSVKAT